MDKYSVKQEAPAKTSASGAVLCPVCGKEATQHGNIYKCPAHGTEPWEGP
jgi:predicted RNA-binding Zn-ribbon protein involved in translation (DUF1610 family)